MPKDFQVVPSELAMKAAKLRSLATLAMQVKNIRTIGFALQRAGSVDSYRVMYELADQIERAFDAVHVPDLEV
jgi:hypothetical protein